MEVIKTEIEGVVIIEPRLFKDERGYFFESFSQRDFDKQVRTIHFVQDNESKSSYGVLRGLHFQKPPFAQSKLVRVIKGAVLDVAVDIRKGSPTFGQHVAVELTEDNHRQFFIPRGFAHGFSGLSDEVIFQYKCDNFYAPQSEGAIAWNDPVLKIDWRIPTEKVILSEKDKHHPLLADAEWLFDYHEDLYKSKHKKIPGSFNATRGFFMPFILLFNYFPTHSSSYEVHTSRYDGRADYVRFRKYEVHSANPGQYLKPESFPYSE